MDKMILWKAFYQHTVMCPSSATLILDPWRKWQLFDCRVLCQALAVDERVDR